MQVLDFTQLLPKYKKKNKKQSDAFLDNFFSLFFTVCFDEMNKNKAETHQKS